MLEWRCHKVRIWKQLLAFIIVFSAVWGSFLPGLTLLGITLFPIRIIAIVWGVKEIFSIIARREAKIKNVGVICTCLLLITGMLTSIVSNDISRSVTAMIVYVTCAICMFISVKYGRNSEGIQFIATAFYINVLIISIIAIYESFTGEYINPSYDYYLTTYNMFGLYRPKTVFYNTNNLTVFLLLSLPICMYATEKWRVSFIFKSLMFALCITGILLTDSRTGIAGLFAYVGLIIYYRVYSINKTFVSLFAILLCFLTMAIFVSSDFSIATMFYSEDRIPIWKAAFQACKDYYFLGAGPGTSAIVEGSLGDPHNYFLEILLEFGVIGLALFCGILKSVSISAKDMKSNTGLCELKTFMVLFLLCSICPSSMAGYYYMWIIFGLLIACKENAKERRHTE